MLRRAASSPPPSSSTVLRLDVGLALGLGRLVRGSHAAPTGSLPSPALGCRDCRRVSHAQRRHFGHVRQPHARLRPRPRLGQPPQPAPPPQRHLQRRYVQQHIVPSIGPAPWEPVPGPAPPPPEAPWTSGIARLNSRRLISVQGPDAAHFLQGLVTRDFTALLGGGDGGGPSAWAGVYCAFLSPRGRVLHDVFIYPDPDASKPPGAPVNVRAYAPPAANPYNTDSIHNPESPPPPSPPPRRPVDGFLIEVDAAQVPALEMLLRRHRLRSRVQLRVLPPGERTVWHAWDDRGPDPRRGNMPSRLAAAVAWAADGDTVMALQDYRVPSMGFRLVLAGDGFGGGAHVYSYDPYERARRDSLSRGADAEHNEQSSWDRNTNNNDKAGAADIASLAARLGVAVAPEQVYRLRRYLVGVPEGQAELQPEEITAADANLDLMGAIDFRKGCYVGQELTIRTRHRGVVRKRVLPMMLYYGGEMEEPSWERARGREVRLVGGSIADLAGPPERLVYRPAIERMVAGAGVVPVPHPIPSPQDLAAAVAAANAQKRKAWDPAPLRRDDSSSSSSSSNGQGGEGSAYDRSSSTLALEREFLDQPLHAGMLPAGADICRVGDAFVKRPPGRWLAGTGNVGLGLCRLEIMTDLDLAWEGGAGAFDPADEFVLDYRGREHKTQEWRREPAGLQAARCQRVIKARAFVPWWMRARLNPPKSSST